MREKQCLILSIVSVLKIAMACSKPSYELLKNAMSMVKSKNETPGLLITHHSFTHHFIRKGAFTTQPGKNGHAFCQKISAETSYVQFTQENL